MKTKHPKKDKAPVQKVPSKKEVLKKDPPQKNLSGQKDNLPEEQTGG